MRGIEYLEFEDGSTFDISNSAVLDGTDNDDVIFGTISGDDELEGGAGNDIINGYEGNDTIYDGAGNDIVYGDAGDDTIHLEGGNVATLNESNELSSFISGGAGSDTFVVHESEVVEPGMESLQNVIVDFEASNPSEKIDLSAFYNVGDISDLDFANITLNDTQYLRVYVNGIENNQYITLKEVTEGELSNDNFIFSDNTAPMAQDDNLNVDEDGSLLISTSDLTSNDTDTEDGSVIFNNVNSSTTNGALINNEDGTYTYTPNENFNGSDSFTYTVVDTEGLENQATANITITSFNDSPVIGASPYFYTDQDSPLTLDLLNFIYDPEGDDLTIGIVEDATNGTATVVDGEVIYTPNENFYGSDSFSYSIDDGNGGIANNTANIDVQRTLDIEFTNNDDSSYDYYQYDNFGSMTVDGLGGNDVIETFSGDDTLFGGSGNDTLSAGYGSNESTGGTG